MVFPAVPVASGVRDFTNHNLFTHPIYRNRLLPILIYDLVDSPIVEKDGQLSTICCSEKLNIAVNTARQYETNLWFFDEDILRSLIACGQATLCLNFVHYIEKTFPDELRVADSWIRKKYELAVVLWKQLNEFGRPDLPRS
jgi:hypothetical protein